MVTTMASFTTETCTSRSLSSCYAMAEVSAISDPHRRDLVMAMAGVKSQDVTRT
jgi:hypothetical protein